MTITQETTRKIIKDFAKEINDKKIQAAPVETRSINFRNGINENREETVWKVPLDLLRFRKENGRISSSVMTHERTLGPLNPSHTAAQEMLRRFLREKDPEKTDELKLLLKADGQLEPGIITADGFLVNGNRRKVALDELREAYPSEDALKTMKVIILPGEDDEGGPPTLKEIEQIENRYQLQTEAKADYYGFDAALSIRDKEKKGYSLADQMRDDPRFRELPERKFRKAVEKRRKEILEPLRWIDGYLDTIKRPGEYSAISKGPGDPEGRWQAFIDLSEAFIAQIEKDRGLERMGIDETEAGKIIQAAYAVIRMREIPNLGKLHTIMRNLPKYTEHGKQHLIDLNSKIKHELTDEENTNESGEMLPKEAIERKWQSKYKAEITRYLVKAKEAAESGNEKIVPLTLLKDVLKKLNHDNMIIKNIEVKDLKKGLKYANDIQARIEEIRTEIYQRVKK